MKPILYFPLLFLFIFGISASPADAQGTRPGDTLEVQAASATELAFAHVYLIRATESPTPWWQTSTLVDAAGGVHTAFYTNQSIVYAHCPADCDDPANWSETAIAGAGSYDSLAYPTLALDANGRPRMMWYRKPDYLYAECNADCTNATQWTEVAVPLASQGNIYPQTAHYFALDSQGHPHFVCYGSAYDDENIYMGFAYTTCDGDCTNASNWNSSLIDLQEWLSWPQIVLNAQDQPRVMGVDSDYRQIYLGCNANCLQTENWGRVTLYEVGYHGNFSFRLDSQGRPRLAFYTENKSDPTLYYAWSNSTAITATAWLSDSLALPPNDERTVDLALDSEDRPHVVLASDQENLEYAVCTANCESDSATWQVQHVETGDELDIEDPIPADPACLSSVWMLLGYPSLALNTADQPNVSYYAQHARMCLGSDGQYHILHDVWALRFATAAATLPCYTLGIGVAPSGGGEVSASPEPNCAGGKYTAGTQVQLNASPADGYRFDQWSGSVSGSTNPIMLSLSEDKSVTANFKVSADEGCETFLPSVIGRLAD